MASKSVNAGKFLFLLTFSVLARQPSRAASPLLRSLRGGGGDPPCVYWKAGGGDLQYIYSCSFTALEAWVDFNEVLRLLIWWRGQLILFSCQRSLRRCLMQPSTIDLGTTALSSPTAWDTAVALGGGRSFIAALALASGLLEEDSILLLCMLGWIFRRQATALATALFGPWPNSSFGRRNRLRSPHHCWSGLRLQS